MKHFKSIVKREIRQLLRNKPVFIFAVIFPFLFIAFFHSLLSDGVARDLPIAVMDLDNSALSREVTSQLDATPQLRVSHHPTSEIDAELLIRTGEVYAFVSIPKNFQKDLRSGRQVKIVNQFNNNVLLAGGLANSTFQKVIGNISAGIQLKGKLQNGKNVKQAIAELQPVQLDKHVLSNPYTNYSYYLNSGFLTAFLQIFVMLTSIYMLGNEHKIGVDKKEFTKIANGRFFSPLLAKLLPYTIWFLFVGIVTYVSMFTADDFPIFGSKILLLLALILLIIATQSIAILFVTSSKSLREALTKGSGFAAVSLSISGITFPIEGMPTILQWLSQIFPFTHYLELLMDQSQRGFPVFYSLSSVAALMLLCIVPFLLSWEKLKSLYLEETYPSRV